MTALYLITGFLGAGKTTFLKEFSRLFPEKKLAVLVNEFGKAGVDGALLSDLRAAVTEVTGGSIFCTCKLDTFESELTALLSHGPDVVLVEASGLSDPTAIWKLLDTRPCFSEVDYRGCICLCDARSFPKVLATARPCRKQLSVCDVLALSKTDVATAEERQAALEAIHALRPDVTVVETVMGVIPPEHREAFLHPLRTARAQDVGPLTADLTLRSLRGPGNTCFYDDHLEDLDDGMSLSWRYDRVRGLYEGELCFYVFLDNRLFLVLQKKYFTLGGPDQFRAFLAERCGSPFQPLGRAKHRGEASI